MYLLINKFERRVINEYKTFEEAEKERIARKDVWLIIEPTIYFYSKILKSMDEMNKKINEILAKE